MSQAVGERTGLYDSTAPVDSQRSAFTSGAVPVAVYGLGKMGLPLAAVYADVTGNTVGVDVDPAVVSTIEAGENPLEREPGVGDLLADLVDDGALRATTDGDAAAAAAAVHVIVVPTLLTEADHPDLSMLEAVVSTVGKGLSPGDLVVVESTVPPRTTVDRVLPGLLDESDVDPEAVGAAACPERTVSGQALADIRGTHPKVLGGVDDESTRVARLIYEEITDNDVITTTDATTAEAVKVFEGVYRDVNIGLANQLARYAPVMDVDVPEAIAVANTQPFCDIHDPGPGVGGHCIPVYPYFLANAFDVDARVLRAARECNDGMPAFTVANLEAILAADDVPLEDADVLVLGVTYKADIAECRNAPAIPIVRQLHDRGASVTAVDPLLEDWSAVDADPVPLVEAFDRSPDAVLLVTPHAEFEGIEWDRFGAPILDGRGAIDASDVAAPVYTVGGRWP